ncbi:unnamed protein product [Brugia pahangi]|uniref:Uncharacterized protein n=1 Tax=Brugia pahangi TaxID=6280 RepID=A0A0N4T2X8_BRUPA|nr:unnamed protein product [Brugia pahangi]
MIHRNKEIEILGRVNTNFRVISSCPDLFSFTEQFRDEYSRNLYVNTLHPTRAIGIPLEHEKRIWEIEFGLDYLYTHRPPYPTHPHTLDRSTGNRHSPPPDNVHSSKTVILSRSVLR